MRPLAERLLKHSDLAAAAAVILVVGMMLIPVPRALIDLLIAANIAGAIAIVMSAMYVSRALDFASFPSLLLLTTLFRLAINISVTRLILLHGDAGQVVHAFGEFVVGGNLVVGLVVFLIIVVIQFAVITSGAGRVAEVAARFTLDAMPGKQMAIDADLNAGQITDEEARQRRAEIGREADFYGAMDGASKFVKGDAIAGVVIVLVGLVAGITVGVLQQGMSAGDAVHTYSILTIGDALGAQIPALLISTATGILVTRSASTENLGAQITSEILGQPRATTIAGGAIAALALVPGIPKLPFLLVGTAVWLVGRSTRTHLSVEARRLDEIALDEALPSASAPLELGPGALAIDPLELSIGFGLVPLVDEQSGGSLLSRIGVVRRQIANELGLVIGPVRVRDDVSLESHEYVVRVRGVEVARTRVVPGHRLAMDPGDAVGGLSGITTVEPAFGLPAVWIAEGQRAEAEALGYTVVDIESVLITHLTQLIRAHADELLTRQETKALLDGLKELNAAVVEEVVPDRMTVGEVQRVLQALLREGVSRRPATRPSSPAIPVCSRSMPDSRSRATSSPGTPTVSGPCRRSRSIPRSSRRSPSRSSRRRTASCSRSTRSAPRCSSVTSPTASTTRRGAGPGRCSSARAACGDISGDWSSTRCRSLRCSRTRKSGPVSESRQLGW
jgi:flagellar biosynthesis protein FlhA